MAESDNESKCGEDSDSDSSSCVLGQALKKYKASTPAPSVAGSQSGKAKAAPRRRISGKATDGPLADAVGSESEAPAKVAPAEQERKKRKPPVPESSEASPAKSGRKQPVEDAAKNIQALKQMLGSVTAEGLMRGTPGCREADVKNKASKVAKFLQEVANNKEHEINAAELEEQSSMVLDMLQIAMHIKQDSCETVVQDAEAAAGWKTSILKMTQANAQAFLVAIAQKLCEDCNCHFIAFFEGYNSNCHLSLAQLME